MKDEEVWRARPRAFASSPVGEELYSEKELERL